MRATYTGRKAIRRDGREHFAEITVRASPGEPPSQVTISAEAIEDLRSTSGADFEFQQRNVRAAVAAQIAIANVAGHLPHVGASSFHAEVLRVRVSCSADREVCGFLLTVAGMDAIGEYLCEWEDVQARKAVAGSQT